mmetsp:Transcript_37880/g.100890  ORF Transcript_37880/g.100890 Transcript_37880/m.100890 type:complete len:251 (-) Transcript_37880:99-851(-)
MNYVNLRVALILDVVHVPAFIADDLALEAETGVTLLNLDDVRELPVLILSLFTPTFFGRCRLPTLEPRFVFLTEGTDQVRAEFDGQLQVHLGLCRDLHSQGTRIFVLDPDLGVTLVLDVVDIASPVANQLPFEAKFGIILIQFYRLCVLHFSVFPLSVLSFAFLAFSASLALCGTLGRNFDTSILLFQPLLILSVANISELLGQRPRLVDCGPALASDLTPQRVASVASNPNLRASLILDVVHVLAPLTF